MAYGPSSLGNPGVVTNFFGWLYKCSYYTLCSERCNKTLKDFPIPKTVGKKEVTWIAMTDEL